MRMTTAAMAAQLVRARVVARRAPQPGPAPKRQDPELGLVKLCLTCGEEWPLDEEFWYRMGLRSGYPYWSSKCRACWADYNTRRPPRSHERLSVPAAATEAA